MRILYSHRTQSSDGQQVHIRELTGALRERGHEIVMAGPGGETSPDAMALDAKKKSVLRSWLPPAIYEPSEFSYSMPAYRRLAKISAALPPDILYERYNLFFHAGAWLRRNTGVPMILEVNAPLAEERARHGGLFWKNFARRSEAAIWRAADMVLPVSGVLADHVRAAGVADAKIEIISNAVSNEFLAQYNPNKIRERYGLNDKVVLGFSGFVREWHGVDRVIRLMVEKKRPELHLLIIGDGPARPALEKLAADQGVSSDVTITGVLQRDQMPDHIAAFDIALQPAVVDYASPLKLFEYMALGKAIIAPDQQNIREIVKNGETALLFPTKDAGAFDKMLSTLIDDAPLRTRLGAAARDDLVRRDLTWNGNAARVETVAHKLIEQKNDHSN